MPEGAPPGEVATFFDSEAVRYDAAYDDPGPGGHPLRMRLAATLRLVGEGPGHVLDAGMGPGRLCAELERRGWTVTGVDASEEMVELARGRAPHARLLQARTERLPFADHSFDVVVATGVLEYAPDRQAVVLELARVLRPGGLAVVSIPNVQALGVRWHRAVVRPVLAWLMRPMRPPERPAPPHRDRPPTATRLTVMLARAGLAVEAEHGTAYPPALGPLRHVLPRTAIRLSARLEEIAQPLRRPLAAQLLLAARRRRTMG